MKSNIINFKTKFMLNETTLYTILTIVGIVTTIEVYFLAWSSKYSHFKSESEIKSLLPKYASLSLTITRYISIGILIALMLIGSALSVIKVLEFVNYLNK